MESQTEGGEGIGEKRRGGSPLPLSCQPGAEDSWLPQDCLLPLSPALSKLAGSWQTSQDPGDVASSPTAALAGLEGWEPSLTL